MFEIDVLASSSSGNAYIIRDGAQSILIECGLPFKKLQELSGYRLSDIEFCLLSHEHKDHSKAAAELLRIGKNIYMSQGTRDALDIYHSSALVLDITTHIDRMGWRVMPFRLQHDAAEPIGFLIESPSKKKICFATDTFYLRYKFAGVTHWMIECNYSEEILGRNDKIHEYVKHRIRTSHFEIESVKDFFRAQDLSRTEKIYLIHLSDDNSDQAEFIRQIRKVTGKIVI